MATATAERLTRGTGGAPPVPPPTPRPPRRQEKVHLSQPAFTTANATRRVHALGRPGWMATSSTRLPSPPPSPRPLLTGVGGSGKMGIFPAPSLPPPSPAASNISRISGPSPTSSPARRRRRPPPPLAPLSRSHEDARFSPTRPVPPMSSSASNSSKTLPHPPPRAAFHGGRVTATRPNFSPPRSNWGRSGSATSPSSTLGVTSLSMKGAKGNCQTIPQQVNSALPLMASTTHEKSQIWSTSAQIPRIDFCCRHTSHDLSTIPILTVDLRQ